MKRITLLYALLVIITMSYAEIGRHNLQINIGGGYQTVSRGERSAYTGIFGYEHPANLRYLLVVECSP